MGETRYGPAGRRGRMRTDCRHSERSGRRRQVAGTGWNANVCGGAYAGTS